MKETMFPHHSSPLSAKPPLKIPLVVQQQNGRTLVMDQMFVKDPRMQRLKEGGPRILCDLPKRQSYAIIRPDGPKDVGGQG